MTIDPNARAAALAAAARKRKLRRRHKRERQAVIFGAVLAGLAAIGLGAAAVWTGGMDAPFDRAFTTIEPSPSADVNAPPCVPVDTLPVPYGSVVVHVYNATTRPGLAGSASDLLGQRGFEIGSTGNFAIKLRGVGRIEFGSQGIAEAYTLAAHIPEVELVYDARTDDVIDLALGARFDELVALDLVPLAADEPMAGVPGCIALTDAVPGPAPAPTPPPGDESQESDDGADAEDEGTEDAEGDGGE